jgi:dipeptide/tripeptide permease
VKEKRDNRARKYGSASSSHNSSSTEYMGRDDDDDALVSASFSYARSRVDSLIHIKFNTQDATVYPTAVIFVLLSKTFEATAANGIRSVLSLFLRDSLLFDERFSIVILHTFNFFSQFLPIGGAILSDCYIGNVKTVAFFFIPYACGYLGIFAATLPYLFTIQ